MGISSSGCSNPRLSWSPSLSGEGGGARERRRSWQPGVWAAPRRNTHVFYFRISY